MSGTLEAPPVRAGGSERGDAGRSRALAAWGGPFGLGVLVVVVALLPVVGLSSYQRSIVGLAGIYVLLAVGYNVVLGYAGVISLGHAGFFGLGAYTVGILVADHGWPFLFAVPVALLLAAVVGAAVAVMSLRITGVHFAVATLAFAESLRLVAGNLADLTGGGEGKPLPLTVDLLPGVPLVGDYTMTLLIWACVVVALYVVLRMTSTSTGSALLAIRENETLARSIGISPLPYRIGAFLTGGMIAALAGGCYAVNVGIVVPETAGLKYTAFPLLMVMLGGRGTVWGPVLGALVFAVAPDLLGLPAEWNEIAFAALLLAVVLVMPRGVVPAASGWLRARRGGSR
jgi:branched-chain amino acid transport system permease protein